MNEWFPLLRESSGLKSPMALINSQNIIAEEARGILQFYIYQGPLLQ